MPRVAFKSISSQQRSTRKFKCFFFLFLLVCFCWVGEERDPNKKKEALTILFLLRENNSCRVSNEPTLNWTGNNHKQTYAVTQRNQSTCVKCQKIGKAVLRSVFSFFVGWIRALCFPEAAGRNISHWLAQVPFLSATFSCVSWYHPSP